MPIYGPAVKRLIPHNPSQDPRITPRVAILHVDAGGATGADLARYFTLGSGGIESHFTIDYDGTVTQFRDTSYQADANMRANDFAISIETQGKAAGQWTPAQLAAIKALLLWLHATHSIPLTQCSRWDGSGVGYHILFMQEWAGGPRACPGPDRIKQFHSELVPWMAGSKGPASPLPSIGSKPKPSAPGKRPRLTVDGKLGPSTIREWQVINGTPVDGVISPVSSLVQSVQRFLNTKGAGLTVDGQLGPSTIRALQRYYGTPVDGVISRGDSSLVRALQTAINRQNGY